MKQSLLIVDDEKPTREGLRAALEDRYDVYIAEDAKAAMNLLESENFDVLLTDFRLPNEDGMKLISRAKSLPKPPVCILMTAYGSEDVAVEAMKRGAVDFLTKPVNIERLEVLMQRALKTKTLEVEVQGPDAKFQVLTPESGEEADPKSMSMVIKSRRETVSMSYDMFFTLRQMFQNEVLRRVDEQIAALVGDSRSD